MCDVLTSALTGNRLGGRSGDDAGGPEQSAPFYGGQAVLEGVMMRGADAWAVAVRTPSQDIHLERHRVGTFARRHPIVRKPLLRGVYALVDSLAIGMKALNISAREALAEVDDDGETVDLPDLAMGASMVLALVVFVGLFIVLPTAGVATVDRVLLGDTLGDGAAFHLVESVVRIAIFLAYLSAISLVGDIRRVFQYHGAEHQTISAWEHGDDLSPDHVGRHSTIHVRCGTNFLILVMVLALVVYTLAGVLVPAPDGGAVVAVLYHVTLRIVLLPVVAALAYEFLRLGAEQGDWLIVRLLMQPGLLLQRVTTKYPDPDQREVAIRAFEAVVPASELGGRVQQDALRSPVRRGHDAFGAPAGSTTDDAPTTPPEPLA